jgi:uncharacterized SAM-binding protein YcdF (DUF218 family)
MADPMFLAYKLSQEALYPLNWAILFLLISLFLMRRKRTRGAAWCQLFGLLLLIVPSTGCVAEALMHPLESMYPAKRVEDYTAAEAIVVLGGTTAATSLPRLEAEEIRGARLLTAARLYRARKAMKIIVTGGKYRIAPGVYRTEAEDMRDVLEGMGVPRDAIVMEQNARNTSENALYTSQLLEPGGGKVLLVTSALHMPRAKALFAKQGVDVEPVPCSFLSGAKFGPIVGLKPEVVHMQHTESAIKEYVGRFVYWLVGRI